MRAHVHIYTYMCVYISRPGKGSRVISRSRVSSDRNAAEVVLVRVAELGRNACAHTYMYLHKVAAFYLLAPDRRTFRVCYTTSNVHYIYYNV